MNDAELLHASIRGTQTLQGFLHANHMLFNGSDMVTQHSVLWFGSLHKYMCSDFDNAFWLGTLSFIFMHWGKTLPSFPTHKYGKYAKKKTSLECNLPLKGTVSSGNETNHVA
jgi:hypothetical protein